MKVRVRVPPVLRELVGDVAALDLEVPEASTIDDVLDAVAAEHTALGRRVRDERGALRVHVNVFVGDDNIRDLDGAATVVHGGDEVSIIAAISGG